MYKGIILAGGSATRLYPATLSVSKQLLPVYDKPMIYYSLCTLMLAGIRDILIISTPRDIPLYQQLLNTGEQWGINLEYIEQPSPEGIPQAFILGKNFIFDSPCALILGDNIFHGHNLKQLMQNATSRTEGASIFAYHVMDPERYGVVEFSKEGKALNLEEKPLVPKSNYAVTGLYFYDKDVVYLAEQLKPSKRNELEITDLNNYYLQAGKLKVEVMRRGYAWFDMGTHDSLLEAGQFVSTLEKRQNFKIGCPEEIALRNGWINFENIEKSLERLKTNNYSKYLKNLILEDSDVFEKV
jgi:glucose-1-phosphate thymidylyltransferase